MFRTLARCLPCLCLSLALVLFGAWGAQACLIGGSVTAMVSCGSDGPEIIHLGADGTPVPRTGGADRAKCAFFSTVHGVGFPARSTASVEFRPVAGSAVPANCAGVRPAPCNLAPAARGLPTLA